MAVGVALLVAAPAVGVAPRDDASLVLVGGGQVRLDAVGAAAGRGLIVFRQGAGGGRSKVLVVGVSPDGRRLVPLARRTLPESFDTGLAVAPAGGGRWLLLGQSEPSASSVVARLLPSGRLDPTFGTAGLVTDPGMQRVIALAVDVLLGGESSVASAGSVATTVARLTARGLLDTTFGVSGLANARPDDAGVRARLRVTSGAVLDRSAARVGGDALGWGRGGGGSRGPWLRVRRVPHRADVERCACRRVRRAGDGGVWASAVGLHQAGGDGAVPRACPGRKSVRGGPPDRGPSVGGVEAPVLRCSSARVRCFRCAAPSEWQAVDRPGGGLQRWSRRRERASGAPIHGPRSP